MSKAEERALKRFPVHKGASKEWIKVHLKDICGDYIEGYHQAEKDLALTWEDMREIDRIASKLLLLRQEDDKDFYQEVLKRFKAKKEK